MTYTYDAAGRIATMTDYFSNAYSYDWTARGELAKITRGTRVWEFAYNALGQRTQYTLPNGMRTEYAYDTWNRLTGIYHKDATTNAVLDSFVYTLNDGNEITRIDHADGSNWRYYYDDRGRLETAIWWDGNNNMEDWYDYTYDDADNMTQYWRANASTQTLDTWDFLYNAANQQTSMTLNSGTAETRTYDDWGRMTARAQGSYSAAYSYRYGDRLRQVTSSFPGETATSPVYEYGGDGKMRRRGTEEIKYGLGFNPVAERANLFMAKSFVYEPGKAVSERLAYFGIGFDTGQQYYNHDHLGSVRRIRSSSKGSVSVWDYEPYGKVHSGTATPLIFALHPYESGIRMHRAPYRNYSPAMARWTTVDPAGMVDGPNMYGYVGGAPVSYYDKFGFCGLMPPGVSIAGTDYNDPVSNAFVDGFTTGGVDGILQLIDIPVKFIIGVGPLESLGLYDPDAPGMQCGYTCGTTALEAILTALGVRARGNHRRGLTIDHPHPGIGPHIHYGPFYPKSRHPRYHFGPTHPKGSKWNLKDWVKIGCPWRTN
jgi:RHS repeat-associated protein